MDEHSICPSRGVEVKKMARNGQRYRANRGWNAREREHTKLYYAAIKTRHGVVWAQWMKALCDGDS